MSNTGKIAGLEEQIGVRGSAEIHSGKRSTLRAWVMAKTGRTAAEILYLGTAALGEVYNDTTDAKLRELSKGTSGAGEAPSEIEDAAGTTPETRGEAPTSPAPEAPETPEAPNGGEDASPSMVEVFNGDGSAVAYVSGQKAAGAVLARFKARRIAAEKLMREWAREEAAKVVPAPAPAADIPRNVVVIERRGDVETKTDVGIQHRLFPLLLKVVQAGLTPALVGPAGSGKTHAAEAVARALYQGRFELQGSCNTKTDIVGFIDAGGRYQSTPFSRSFTAGGVFLGDELDGWHANATLALNAALANGHAALPTGMQARHAEWAPIFALNTYGTGASRQYVGRNQMDAATLNRLAFIAWDYDEALEGAIVGVKCAALPAVALDAGGIPTADTWVDRVLAIRHACDKLKVRHIVSPRASIGGVKLFAVGVGQAHAEEMLIWQGLDAEQRARIESAVTGGR